VRGEGGEGGLWVVADKLVGFCRKVFVSFGGLLLYLEGPYRKLSPLRIDYVYLLMKK